MSFLPGIMIGKVFGVLTPDSDAFTLTAGSIGGGSVVGYGAGEFGTISAEPYPESPLSQIATALPINTSYIAFTGDIASALSGKTVWIDGIEYATGFSGWSFGDGETGGTWSSPSHPVFVEFSTYLIEIKDAS